MKKTKKNNGRMSEKIDRVIGLIVEWIDGWRIRRTDKDYQRGLWQEGSIHSEWICSRIKLRS